MIRLFLSALFCLPLLAQAAPSAAEKAAFEHQYLQGFLAKTSLKLNETALVHRPPNCDPDFQDDPNCVQVACSFGSLRCASFQSDAEQAAQICQGVSGQCLTDTCAYGAYRCGSFSSDLEKVGELCRGIRPYCVKAVCDQGALKCGTFSSDLDKAAELCKGGARASCIQQMCGMGSYKCGTFSSDLEKVVELCNQQ